VNVDCPTRLRRCSRGSSLNPLDTGASADPVFSPETIDAFELGAKVDWMDGAAPPTLAVFYNDIKDLQSREASGLASSPILNSQKQNLTAQSSSTPRPLERGGLSCVERASANLVGPSTA